MKTYDKSLSYRILQGVASLLAGGLLLSGCSKEDDTEKIDLPEAAGVRVELALEDSPTKTLGDATHSVNRILLLPFKKINEAGSDTPSNFAPVYASGKQLDINSFMAYSVIPALSPTSTYRMLVIGYNRTNYNYNPADPTAVSGAFSLGAESAPVTLANFRIKLTSPVSVPEFFSTVCTAYGPEATTVIGPSFKPQHTKLLKGTLQRWVSGLSVQITGIPAYVTSVTLSAEQLVTSSTATGGTPVTWQTSGDAGVKTLATAVPSAGSVLFEKLLLPTLEDRKTRLKLQVFYGSTSETYTIKVTDKSGVADSNYFIFQPNRVIKITGVYASINFGFLLSETINLDDNAWDGYN